jgi:hypothetical protein
LIRHVEEGWEIVKELEDGKFILRKQNACMHFNCDVRM